jgi:hypothetical protein
MRALHLRTAAVLLAAGVGLGGCASYSPYGYGNGVSIGYGNGYNDAYYDGYGSRYGYGYGSRYGAGYSPYGWYDGFYYPGAGYYVYDQYRNPYYWNDYQRRYWTVRQRDPSVREVWSDFARRHAGTTSGTASQMQRVTTNNVQRIRQVERVRSDRVERIRSDRAERRSESRGSVSDRIRSRVERAAKKD